MSSDHPSSPVVVPAPTGFSGFLDAKNYKTQPKPIGPTKKAVRILKKQASVVTSNESDTSEGMSGRERTEGMAYRESPPFRVLDLGSGGAKCTYHVASELKDVYQLEVTSVELDSGGRKYVDMVSREEGIAGKVFFIFKNISIEQFLNECSDERFDLVIGSYSLFYIKDFDTLIGRVLALVKPNGIFCGHFLGDEDDWNTGKSERPKRELKFISRQAIINLFEMNGFSFVAYRDKDERSFESDENVIVNGVQLDHGRGTKVNKEGFKERRKIGYRFKNTSTMHSFHVVAMKSTTEK